MNRRQFLTVSAGALAAGALGTAAFAKAEKPKNWAGETGPAVYFTRDLSAAGLQKAYAALGVSLPDKVGVKVSTGEPGGTTS